MLLLISKLTSKHLFIPLLIGVLWLLLFIIVNPIGEFPLNDDWAFSKNVYYLVEQGILKFSDWPAMTLIVQTLIGALFCSIFGFSFTVLRFSTIFMGFLGLVFTYLLISELTKNKKMATIATLLVAINPLFFSLSATFMTDVYFYTFNVLSFFFFFKYVKNNQTKLLIIATLLSIAATLIRQIGVLIPLSFALSYLYRKEINFKTIAIAGLPFILTLISLLLYNTWFDLTQEARPKYGTFVEIINKFENILALLKNTYLRIGYILNYVGFFVFPLLIINIKKRWCVLNLKNRIKSLIITSLFILPIFRMWNDIPTGNVINNFCLGPKCLRDYYLLWQNNYSFIPDLTWTIINIIALIGAFLLVFTITTSLLNTKKILNNTHLNAVRRIQLMSILFFFLYSILLFMSNYYFDRYILSFLPLIFIVILPIQNYKINKYFVAFSIAFILTLGSFSVLATHDYLSWNRARWEALNDLTKKDKIYPHFIDGGFEFNGWYLSETVPEDHDDETKSWWWVFRDDYLITFGSVSNYKVIKRYSFDTFFGEKHQYIFVLEKDSTIAPK